MSTITYRLDADITGADLGDLFRRSAISRPLDDAARLERMVKHANLTITAWDGEKLVGISRSLTDFAFCCYLSCLAVDLDYQKQGIGKELIRITRQAAGEQSNLLLLAAPTAMPYYPQVGFEFVENAWIMRRAA